MYFDDFKKNKIFNFLARGWRGEIYMFEEDNRLLCVKKAISKEAIYAITKEANILSCLFKDTRFPQVLYQGRDFFVYHYINAVPFERVFYNLADDKKRYILKQILKAAYDLDNLGINRGEFDKEYKNILIDEKLNVYVLDFDRGSFSKYPKNVTQFIQSLRVKNYLSLEKAINLGKSYKTSQEQVYLELLHVLENSPSIVFKF